MLESILIGAITVAMGGLVTYAIAKRLTRIEYILEISDVLLDELTQNAEMQKKVYVLGVLLGNGIKVGIGLQKGKGKFKLDDLIGMGIAHFFGNIFKGKENEEQMSPIDQNLFKQPL